MTEYTSSRDIHCLHVDNIIHDVLENTLPLSCVLSGSRAYGTFNQKSDYDYIGLHLSETGDLLSIRSNPPQIITATYNQLHERESSNRNSLYSIKSFEIAAAVQGIRKNSFECYDLINFPMVFQDERAPELMNLMRKGLNSGIIHAVQGIFHSNWKKDPTSIKKTFLLYYRALQVILFLRSEHWEWEANPLEDVVSTTLYPELIKKLRVQSEKPESLAEKEVILVEKEINKLIEIIEDEKLKTVLPDQFPRISLDNLDKKIVSVRASLI